MIAQRGRTEMRHLSKTIAGTLLAFALTVTPVVSNMSVMANTPEPIVVDEGFEEPTYINESNTYLSQDMVNAYLAGYSANDANIIGFFLRIGEQEAAAIVARGVAEGHINLSDPSEPTNFDYLKQAARYVDECNLYRSWAGAGELRIDPVLVAVSIVQTNISKNTLIHSNLYTPYECLAVGGTIGAASNSGLGNPFDMWYWDEATYQGIHYRNLLRPDFTTTGFAVCSNAFYNGYVMPAFGQTFDVRQNGNRTYSVSEFIALLDNANTDTNESAQAMYRMYNPNNSEHFYTGDVNEVNVLEANGWQPEGIGWYAPNSGAPVYRLYNPNSGIHHYTMDRNECNTLVAMGWKEEPGWLSAPQSGVPLYRQYNPNAPVGQATHNYTTDQNEVQVLNSAGWINEGVCWYGV